MPNLQPIVTDTKGRKFAASVAAVLAYVINEDEKFLLLKHPKRDGWEVVNGALDAGETVLDGVLRETREEAGPKIEVEPLGTIHSYTFTYDDNVQFLISIAYLLIYKDGEVIPGSDMTGSEVGWFSVEEIESGSINMVVPREYFDYMFRRGRDLYRLWKDQERVELQKPLDSKRKNKHGY